MWIFIVTMTIVVGVSAWIFSYIDDWSRDLTQNYAETNETANEPDLRPRTFVSLSPGQVADKVEQFVSAHKLWHLEQREEQSLGVKMHLIRRTALLRFTDDIHVEITPSAGDSGSVLGASSKSRLGKGDLGQNPRNLRELLVWLSEN